LNDAQIQGPVTGLDRGTSPSHLGVFLSLHPWKEKSAEFSQSFFPPCKMTDRWKSGHAALERLVNGDVCAGEKMRKDSGAGAVPPQSTTVT
jgi:hypothetical protein